MKLYRTKTAVLALCLILSPLLHAEGKELRGAWFAWAGSNVPSRETIAESMEALADANFNIVYVDVWRYGYPYFLSEVFKAHTGHYTDPGLYSAITPERDVLAEMIAEAHHAGLEVDAWFEAGFNAGITQSSPVYQAHPDWVARKQNGDVAYYGQAGPSSIHVLPEVKDFLIDLCRELVHNYDIDGVEFDRVRYPSLDCGYDSYTKELYKSETGSYPPTSVSDASWIRWRADKLTAFVAELYDSIKAMNPYVIVSNAPLPWGYEQFCQDYAPWIDEGHLDIVSPQMYMNSNTDFTWRLNTELAKTDRDSAMYPGISTVANSNYTDPSELAEQIRTTRNAGLKGNVIWYHHELINNNRDYLSYLKENVYSEKVEIPYRSDSSRSSPLIIGVDSSAVIRNGNWETYSGTNVYGFYNDAYCYIADADSTASISYSAAIPEEGFYTLYAFQNIPKSMASASGKQRSSSIRTVGRYTER
ncbi:MAG: family 10 glycosylhydrolase [Candidatus Marinimicrobia bacterium]|nr:family 10 glycosylhydrolase [Candidatus Neomarinimicrobiota bacterium]